MDNAKMNASSSHQIFRRFGFTFGVIVGGSNVTYGRGRAARSFVVGRYGRCSLNVHTVL